MKNHYQLQIDPIDLVMQIAEWPGNRSEVSRSAMELFDYALVFARKFVMSLNGA